VILEDFYFFPRWGLCMFIYLRTCTRGGGGGRQAGQGKLSGEICTLLTDDQV